MLSFPGGDQPMVGAVIHNRSESMGGGAIIYNFFLLLGALLMVLVALLVVCMFIRCPPHWVVTMS
jgi:hypothetical protein